MTLGQTLIGIAFVLTMLLIHTGYAKMVLDFWRWKERGTSIFIVVLALTIDTLIAGILIRATGVTH